MRWLLPLALLPAAGQAQAAHEHPAIAASFCDLNHPIHLEQASGTPGFLRTHSGQRCMGRTGQDRPRAR